MIGRTLAHFEILEKIGAGGMGEVYRARDTKLGREVALKTLPPELAADPARLKRFVNEARTVASLNHPNIVTIYSIEESEGLHFLTMELIKGGALNEQIPENGVPHDRFMEIALPLTDALSAAHEVGVIHRDLKPSNLMLVDGHRVKILDFGLATFVERGTASKKDTPEDGALATRTQLTGEGVIVGTMPYMSPEQIESKPVDARSDIFSLGIIFYELVTGRRPFHGDTNPSLISSILKDIPPPVTHLNPAVPGDVGGIIGRCLEKDPEGRFQSARAIHDALRAQKDQPVAAVPVVATPSSDPTRFSQDIFISYAQLDNEAQLAGQEGWGSAFHRSLEVRVGQLLGKKPSIFRDPKSHGTDTLEEDQMQRIPKSALLISVLSPRYVKSEWCTRELREFVSAAGNTGGPKWGAKYRMFKVVKTPTPVERHPPEIQPLLGYEFFKMDPETGRARELDQIFGPDAQREYWARLDDLAHDLVGLLETVEEAGSTVDGPAPDPGAIYLAATSHDLKQEHDAMRRDLQRHGYAILPDQPLPLVEDELQSYVRDQLDRARMSIHLMGRNYGLVPEGATESVIGLQNALAIERADRGDFNRVLWIPAGIEIADERQQRFVAQLRADPRLNEGSDMLEGPLEDLKTVVHQMLNPPERAREPRTVETSASDVSHVYLICDQRDQDETSPLADFLFESGFEVTLPVFEGDEAEVREDHEDNLRMCDAVLVYYGAGNELWLRRKLREVQKSAGLGRSKAMRAKGIWIAPPVTPQKTRLRTRDAVVMTAAERFAPDPLRPFIQILKGAA